MSKRIFKIFSCRLEWLLIVLTVLVVKPAKAQDIPKSNSLVNWLRPAKVVQEAKADEVTRIPISPQHWQLTTSQKPTF